MPVALPAMSPTGSFPSLPMLLATLVLSPICAAVAAIGLIDLAPKPAVAHTASDARCYEDAAYRSLSKLPPGLVLGEIDLGPFILSGGAAYCMTLRLDRTSQAPAAILAAE